MFEFYLDLLSDQAVNYFPVNAYTRTYEYEYFRVDIVRKLNGMKLKIIFYFFLLLSSARFQAVSEQ
jgi:hypothetical protein